jgi:hypothetical protein
MTHFDIDRTEVLATVSASLGRRVLGLGCLAGLGVMVLYLAVTTSPGLPWRLFLLALGGVFLWIADMMRRSTEMTLELTSEELRETGGAVIARLEDIAAIDRGFFAFKPSNGFLLKVNSHHPRAWRPGLWWRMGRRIGVGGMTPASATKNMSEMIAILIAQRGASGGDIYEQK